MLNGIALCTYDDLSWIYRCYSLFRRVSRCIIIFLSDDGFSVYPNIYNNTKRENMSRTI